MTTKGQSQVEGQNENMGLNEEEEPKWDYTTSESTFYTGAAVVGLNLLVILAVILDRFVPSFHSFITGK